MGFSRQEYWSGLPCPPPVYLSNLGLNLYLLCLLNWHMGSLPPAPPGKPKENMKWSESHSVVSDSLQSHGLHIPWNSPGQNTGVGKLSLLQQIFPAQESNQGLLHRRRILYQLSYEGSPKENILVFKLILHREMLCCSLSGWTAVINFCVSSKGKQPEAYVRQDL